jgi:hypothetical protein
MYKIEREREPDIQAHVAGTKNFDPRFGVWMRKSPARRAGDRRKLALLVHGASACSRTFDIPKGGLTSYLQDAGFDVYAIDWRSSMLTVGLQRARNAPGAAFTMDAALGDLTAGIAWVAGDARLAEGEEGEISIVGHCVGGALVSAAIAAGICHSSRVVLTALGLFHRVGLEGWLKGNDTVLDDIYRTSPETVISASAEPPWPAPFEDRYKLWLATRLGHGCKNTFCDRASFMYGMPFRPDDIGYVHDAQKEGLATQFGDMPVGIYAHCAQNLRRGWIAPFNGVNSDANPFHYLNASPFRDKRITLITGNENQLWHRDSIDRMYAWLVDELPAERSQFVKHVLPRYGHQDLYWSTEAKKDVYPKILAGLEEPAAAGPR